MDGHDDHDRIVMLCGGVLQGGGLLPVQSTRDETEVRFYAHSHNSDHPSPPSHSRKFIAADWYRSNSITTKQY